MLQASGRFNVASDDEIAELLENSHSNNTNNIVTCSLRILATYLNHYGMLALTELTSVWVEELDQVLKHFYVYVRKYDYNTKKSMIRDT
jgi:DNA replicative helicase MCM subunit Mcm2 (Cdc46/Mcm family)